MPQPRSKEQRLATATAKPNHDGAQWRYAKGCRCNACRVAWRDYRRERYAAHKRAALQEEIGALGGRSS